MPPEAVGIRTRIFQFAVPGLPELWFGLPIRQVVEVIPLPVVLPVPLTPSHVIGICLRAARIVGVIEIAQILYPNHGTTPGVVATHLLVAAVAREGRQELIGIPVNEGATLRDIPARLPAEAPPTGLVESAASLVVRFDNHPLVLLDLNRLIRLNQ